MKIIQAIKNTKNHTFITLLCLLGLICLGLAPNTQASNPHSIVGLWVSHYVSTTNGSEAYTHDQWYSDGLEFEAGTVAPGAVCQGTYERISNGSYRLYHVAWTFDPSTGVNNGYWDEHLIATVSSDGQSYSGTYARKFYDVQR